MSKQNIIIVIVVILAAVLAAGFWYWQSKKAVPTWSIPVVPLAEKTGAGIGVALFDKSRNPIVDKLAETNPFALNVNPFEQETNPLKALYKNPFQ